MQLQRGYTFGATETVTNAKLATLVDSATAVAGSIVAADLASGSVTGPKIAMGSDAQGDMLQFNGTSYVRLPTGTSGQFLKSQGAGANNVWAAVPSAVASATHVSSATPTTTTSGVAVLLDSMTITFTPASATNKILIWFSGWFSHDTANTAIVTSIEIDGSSSGLVTSTQASHSTTGQAFAMASHLLTTLTVASHTIRVSWSTTAGTATCSARRLTVLELTA